MAVRVNNQKKNDKYVAEEKDEFANKKRYDGQIGQGSKHRREVGDRRTFAPWIPTGPLPCVYNVINAYSDSGLSKFYIAVDLKKVVKKMIFWGYLVFLEKGIYL